MQRDSGTKGNITVQVVGMQEVSKNMSAECCVDAQSFQGDQWTMTTGANRAFKLNSSLLRRSTYCPMDEAQHHICHSLSCLLEPTLSVVK